MELTKAIDQSESSLQRPEMEKPRGNVLIQSSPNIVKCTYITAIAAIHETR